MFQKAEESSPLLRGPSPTGPFRTLGEIKSSLPEPMRNIDGRPLDNTWSLADWFGAFLARASSRRNDYRIQPGLYAYGNPDENSEVLVSANYKYSFDRLRRELGQNHFWILVLDTRGINVWCAAGKGTFGTEELIRQIKESGLIMRVAHRRVIVPQLGGVGIAAHEVKKESGFRVSYGPVEARDLLAYLENNRKTTPEMRRIRFNWRERLVLVPMEVIPVMKYYLWFALGALLVFGLRAEGFLFREMYSAAGLYLLAGVSAITAGAILTPLLLPLLPFHAFSAKGALAGVAISALLLYWLNLHGQEASLAYNHWFALFAIFFIPTVSSFLALQFTGSSTYTNMSGVYKEHNYAIPFYLAALVLSGVALVVHKVSLFYDIRGWFS